MRRLPSSPCLSAMFVPIYDLDNPLRRVRFPFVNFAFISLNVAVFLMLQSGFFLPESVGHGLNVIFGVIPVEITTSQQVVPGVDLLPEPITLVTYMFLHGGWLHLGGNMLFLWVFGDNVEDAMGHGRYLLFVLLCGVAGALVHVLVGPASGVPLVGASGAIAGVVAGYLVLHPRVKLWCLVAGRIPLRVDARWALGAWVVMQFAFALLLADEEVAWWAHVGGVLAGAALIVVLRRKDVALLDQDLPATPPPPPMPTLPARQG